jgi:hypothetical protein
LDRASLINLSLNGTSPKVCIFHFKYSVNVGILW